MGRDNENIRQAVEGANKFYSPNGDNYSCWTGVGWWVVWRCVGRGVVGVLIWENGVIVDEIIL